MDHRDPKPIYESPDGGATVYVRIGDARFNINEVTPGWIDAALERYQSKAAELREADLWRRVVEARHSDKDIADLLDQARQLYLLRSQN